MLIAQLTSIIFGFSMINIILIYLVFLTMGVQLSLDKAALYNCILIINKCFNIMPGNIGLTEYICGSLSNILGGKLGDGIIVSGIIRIIEYIFVCLLGSIFFKTVFPDLKSYKIDNLNNNEI